MRRYLLLFVAGLVASIGGCSTVIQLPPESGSAGFGDGHLGDAVISSTGQVLTLCQPVAAAAGDTVTTSTPNAITTSALLLVMQMQDTFAQVGDSTAITASGTAGATELVRVSGVNGATLTVTPPLTSTFSSAGAQRAQLCRVSEYENLTIDSSGSIVAMPWDGTKGGVIAIFARGRVEIRGRVDASGAGFRGGLQSDGSATTTAAGIYAMTTNAGLAGGKGESLDGRAWGLAGRGQLGNGAGGGNHHNAGGGGGAGGGAGGAGGMDQEGSGGSAQTQGGPGSAVMLPFSRISLGGGGGGGHQDSGNGSSGARGGGVVLIAAADLAGGGGIFAHGGSAGDSGLGGPTDGAGGGGGGGTILLVATTGGFAGAVGARGGSGGNAVQPQANNRRGPGGGGGGGRIYLRMNSLPLAPDVSGGTSGVNVFVPQGGPDPVGDAHGALPGATGIVDSGATATLPF